MRLWVAVTCLMLLAGCGSGSGPSNVDVTGWWDATITHTTCTTQNLDSRPCGAPGHGILTLTQTGRQVSGRNFSLIVLQGQFSGDTLTLDGFGTDPIGSTTTQRWRLRVSGDQMTGTLSETFVSPIGLPDSQSQGTKITFGDVTAVRRR